MRKVFLSLIIILIVSPLAASHYISGFFHYQYIGKTDSNNIAYAITLTLNRDCYSSQQNFPAAISVGIYENNTSAYLQQKVSLKLINEERADPFASPNISVGYCIRKHTYTDTVILPNTAAGYQLYYSFRNSYYTAQVVYGIIPPNAANNIMPKNDLAVFYAMRAGETFVFDASIYNIDNDSFTYQLAMPYYREGNNISELPNRINSDNDLRSENTLNLPNLLGGRVDIDASTGLFIVKATNPARFTLAVDITKWRNGNAIATYRFPIIIQSIIKNYPTNAYISIAGTKKPNVAMLSWLHSLTAVKQFYIERKLENTTWQRIDSTLGQNGNDNSWFADTVERRYRVVAVGEMNKIPITVISDEWKTGGGPTAMQHVSDIGITVYPNPATDKLYFDIRGREIPQSIIIYTLQGKHIKTMILDAHVINSGIDISVLPSGIYYIQIQTQQGIQTQKIVKQ